MNPSKRRLSQGNSLIAVPLVDEDELETENEIDPMALINSAAMPSKGRKSNSPGTRRRSSFTGLIRSPTKSSAEQSRIADMYKNVIKLSSENVSILLYQFESDETSYHKDFNQKINEKNSWSFDLIDHMGSIIKSESQDQRGINFQKVLFK